MTARARHRGHPIRWAGNKWTYTGGDPVHLISGSERPCAACGRVAQQGGPDPCLGRLKGVAAACCGHGHTEDAYIMFHNRITLRGEDALRLIRCWTQHRVTPDTVLAVYQECHNLDLTEEICRVSDTAGYSPEDLIGAATVIEQLRRNSFDFVKACGILEVAKENK